MSEENKKEETKQEEESFMHRVRISGVIVDGNLDIARALTNVKGIGARTSKTVVPMLGFPEDKKIGSLNEKEIKKIEETIENIHTHVPEWMVNRKKDPETGKNLHSIGPDLDMTVREDLNRMKKMKSYKGIRHQLHLPVRGQRTRSTFRHGSTIGVSRKKNK